MAVLDRRRMRRARRAARKRARELDANTQRYIDDLRRRVEAGELAEDLAEELIAAEIDAATSKNSGPLLDYGDRVSQIPS